MKHWVGSLAVAVALLHGERAQAFCGFYVSGADASLYNDATMVVLMRDGTRTVLSMQNSYRGPAEAFAMVVPVPVVLQEDNVKTLPAEIFGRVDRLAAPRLVEYWEQDPCEQLEYESEEGAMLVPSSAPVTEMAAGAADHGVRIEAQFAVGEYDIVILSAAYSSGLDAWLRQNEYNIPEGAEPVLRPYVAAGTKFFVAKVDPRRARFENGRAVLSPLRFHYDSDTFSLPVRLGLLNSQGDQDLIVHVLARNQRYEVANYANAFIPTNIRVRDAVRDGFGSFYDALFEAVRSHNARTVVTEYSWDASSCDPCPEPALDPGELATLGQDVVGGDAWSFVLTRLHYRYGRGDLGQDLVFRAAPPVIGGRGMPTPLGELTERDAQQSSMNNFQGRYVILHHWEGPVQCESPQKGRWGGPPQGATSQTQAAVNARMTGAALPPADLGMLVAESIPSLDVIPGQTSGAETSPTVPPSASGNRGCAACTVGSTASPLAGLVALGLAFAWRLRRRR